MEASNDYTQRDEETPTMGKMPCQNCGKMVTVMLPFIGCVFCGDCMRGDSSSEANSEAFHKRWLYDR